MNERKVVALETIAEQLRVANILAWSAGYKLSTELETEIREVLRL